MMESRIVSQLLSCLDDMNTRRGINVLVIGATNRPDSLDPALRRAGRFDHEICMGIPNEAARESILRVQCKDLKLEEEFDFQKVAHSTPGFVGADLMALAREAAMLAVNRAFKCVERESRVDKAKVERDELIIRRQSEADERKRIWEETKKRKQEEREARKLALEAKKAKEATEKAAAEKAAAEKKAAEDAAAAEGEGDKEKAAEEGEKKEAETKTEPAKSTPAVEENGDATKEETSEDVEMEEPEEDEEPPPEEVIDEPEVDEETIVPADFISVFNWLQNMRHPIRNEQMKDVCVTMADFESARKGIQPSAKREGFMTIPDITWADVGSLKDIRKELELSIMAPVKFPEKFESLGLVHPAGILLAGPPGCGKTLVAKAIANETGVNFISVKGPELLNMYVGESERAVRQVFQRARNSAPCVIFFDELDSLCPKRSDNAENAVTSRVVNQLLTEMDGMNARKQVFIIAATNRPDIIDPAVLRPGRLDKVLFVGIPTPEDKLDILSKVTKNGSKPLLAKDVDLKKLAVDKRTIGFTGADLAGLVREASVCALTSLMNKGDSVKDDVIAVTKADFETAFTKVRQSVSDKDRQHYEQMAGNMATTSSAPPAPTGRRGR